MTKQKQKKQCLLYPTKAFTQHSNASCPKWALLGTEGTTTNVEALLDFNSQSQPMKYYFTTFTFMSYFIIQVNIFSIKLINQLL